MSVTAGFLCIPRISDFFATISLSNFLGFGFIIISFYSFVSIRFANSLSALRFAASWTQGQFVIGEQLHGPKISLAISIGLFILGLSFHIHHLYTLFPTSLVDCLVITALLAVMQNFNPQQVYGQRGGLPPQMPMPQQFRPAHGMPMTMPTNLKVPPPWNPQWESEYPFRTWVQDALLWCASTDIDAERQGPAIVMGLQGTAKEMSHEVDLNTLQNGAILDFNDGQGAVPRT